MSASSQYTTTQLHPAERAAEQARREYLAAAEEAAAGILSDAAYERAYRRWCVARMLRDAIIGEVAQ